MSSGLDRALVALALSLAYLGCDGSHPQPIDAVRAMARDVSSPFERIARALE